MSKRQPLMAMGKWGVLFLAVVVAAMAGRCPSAMAGARRRPTVAELTAKIKGARPVSALFELSKRGAKAKTALPEVRRMIGHRDPGVRGVALRALAAIAGPEGKGVISAVTAGLRDPDPNVRKRCMSILAGFGPKAESTINALIRAAGDARPELRAEAIAALTAVDPKAKKTLSLLCRAIRDPDMSVRKKALLAISTAGPDGRGAASALLSAVSNSRYQPRAGALGVLGRIGAPGAVPVLSRELGNPKMRHLALRALAGIGPPAQAALPQLEKALRNPDAYRRMEVVETLIAVRAHKVLARVAETDPDKTVHDAAFKGLAEMKLPAKKLVPILKRLMKGKNKNLQTKAAALLGSLGEKDKQSWPALVDASLSKDAALRASARSALEARAHKSISELNGLASDSAVERRKLAVELLGKVNSPKVIPSLISAMADKDPTVRNAAAYGLGQRAGTDSPLAAKALIKALDDSDPSVRKTSLIALPACGPLAVEALPALVKKLRSRGSEVRYICKAIRSMGPAAAPVLVKMHAGADAVTRRNVLRALSWSASTSKKVAPLILSGLQDKDREVRIAACGAAATRTDLVKSTCPKLLALGQDREKKVANAAGATIARMMRESKDTAEVVTKQFRGLSAAGRLKVVQSLGPPIPDHIAPLLILAMEDKDSKVRAAGCFMVPYLPKGGAATRKALAVLVVAMKDANAEVRNTAARVAGQFPSEAKLLLPGLVKILADDAQHRVRKTAARSVKSMGKAAVPALEGLLKHKDPVVRKETETLLKSIRK